MPSPKLSLCALIGVTGTLCFSLALNADPPKPAAPTPGAASREEDAAKPEDERMSVAEARARARLMHKIYASTLEVMHHYYFRENRPVLPARALEDVFADLDEQTKIQTRWIAVNTPAMSIQHQPESAFEKKAAAMIARGQNEYDSVENGYYRHAGAIPLGSSCVACHNRFSQQQAKTPRFAGLVITIPVQGE
jgi:hypothetical protein